MHIKIFVFLTFLLITSVSVAQDAKPVNPFLDFEMSVQQLFNRILQERDDELKEQINDSIKTKFSRFLQQPESFQHSFDSLKSIGAITSDDDILKIYTWNLPFMDGSHGFFGFLQINIDNSIKTIELQHQFKKIPDFENAVITPSNWYGALYYDIIEEKFKGDNYYTLLAYDPHDIFTKKKIIDIINIGDGEMVTFGRPVFQMKNTTKSRVIFEYSARVAMMLRFNETMDMIVYDHLSPSSPAYEGRFQYYGPDLSYDGFEFDKGFWIHKENIQIQY